MKVETDWDSNPSSETDEYVYNSSVYAYNSTLQNFDGVLDTDLSDTEKTPAFWDKSTLTETDWDKNPSAEVDEYDYNSSIFSFNSTSQNYDGVVDTDLFDSELIPTDWDNANPFTEIIYLADEDGNYLMTEDGYYIVDESSIF